MLLNQVPINNIIPLLMCLSTQGDDDEHDNDNNVDSPPAAGFSTSPSI
jgi:hypothetical protein